MQTSRLKNIYNQHYETWILSLSNVQPTFDLDKFFFHFFPMEDMLKTRVKRFLQRNSKNVTDVIFVQKRENIIE